MYSCTQPAEYLNNTKHPYCGLWLAWGLSGILAPFSDTFFLINYKTPIHFLT